MAIFAANWKMNPGSVDDAVQLMKDYADKGAGGRHDREIIIFVPDFFLFHVVNRSNTVMSDMPELKFGCQRLSRYTEGPHTAETSPLWFEDYEVSDVLVGHSEVRAGYEEVRADPDLVNRVFKEEIRNALDNGMRVMYCVGETLEERSADAIGSVLESQICTALGGLKPDEYDNVAIAYEPRWAISDGKTPVDPPSISDMQAARNSITGNALYKIGCSPEDKPKILYGGSVTPDNIAMIMSVGFDGVLVGGASLDADKFSKICSYDR